jgi:hypothetical protein
MKRAAAETGKRQGGELMREVRSRVLVGGKSNRHLTDTSATIWPSTSPMFTCPLRVPKSHVLKTQSY